MTRQELLSTARLRLVPQVQISRAHKSRVIMQSPAGLGRVVVTPVQAGLLTEFFSQPSTVPAALVSLLSKRQSPPLRDYYELVLQCCEVGVLVAHEPPALQTTTKSWPLRIPPSWACGIGNVAFVMGVLAAVFGTWRLPQGALEWIGSLLAASCLISLGQVLAACSLAGANCSVRKPRFAWKTLLPHFRVETSEATMGGPEAEMAVAVMRMAPLALGAAAAAWWLPGFLLAPCIGLLLNLAPWDNSAAMQWLRARFGAPLFSIDSGTLMEAGDEEAPASRTAIWSGLGKRGFFIWAFWGLLWCTMLVAAATCMFPGIITRLSSWANRFLRDEFWLRASLGVLAAAALLWLAWLIKSSLKRWIVQRRWRKRLGEKESLLTHQGPLAGDTTSEMLKQFAVLQGLGDEDLNALAAALQPVQYASGTMIFEEDEPGDAFYFVLEGSLEVRKRLPGRLRRSKLIGLLGAGDSFGEIALLEQSPRTASVRAQLPSRLLRLSRDDFDRLLAKRIGAEKLREVLQYTAFLGRLVHFAGWPFEDLARFAHRCTSVRIESGTRVLRRGEPNAFFYLVYDGILEETSGAKVLRRLTPGDYFGESCLLDVRLTSTYEKAVDYYDAQGSMEAGPALADVVAVEESRCLAMRRSDFLDFFARDFRVGMRMAAHVKRR